MKIKAIVLSLVLVIFTWSANASAALQGNMGFTMLDAVNGNSWTVDLGVSVNDAIGGALNGQMFNILGLLDAANADTQIGVDISTYVWSVAGAIDNNLVASLSGPEFTFGSASDLIQVNTNLNEYWVANSDTTNEVVGQAVGYYDAAPGGYNGNIGGATGATRNLEAQVGESMGVYLFNGGSIRPVVLPTTEFLTDASFTADGYLIFGDVQPIPVPAAVWFMGSALIGMVGFARKRQMQA